MSTEADVLGAALRRAYHLGQVYWQQADSEYTSQHRKADETQAKFDALLSETVSALAQPVAAEPEQEPAPQTGADIARLVYGLAEMIEAEAKDPTSDFDRGMWVAARRIAKEVGAHVTTPNSSIEE